MVGREFLRSGLEMDNGHHGTKRMAVSTRPIVCQPANLYCLFWEQILPLREFGFCGTVLLEGLIRSLVVLRKFSRNI
jgi:hypothetical protein